MSTITDVNEKPDCIRYLKIMRCGVEYTLNEFELVYQQKYEKDEGFKFLIPYDFKEEKMLITQAGQANIPVFGVSLPCLIGR